MQKILVTGGAGYIGSHTVVALHEAGFEPVIVDNFSNADKSAIDGIKAILQKSPKLYQGDCNDAAFMDQVFAKEGKIAGVIHFAASKAVGESVQKPIQYYANNINSLLVLLQTMEKHQCPHLVFSSSCTVYGQPDKLPVTETTPKKQATSPYGNTKAVCEEILEDAVTAKYPIKAIALRYFNPIGAHPSAHIGELPIGVPNNLVPFVTQAAAGIREKITVFGNDYDTPDGTCLRDYIHVMDLADAHVKAFEFLEKQNQSSLIEYFNVGTGKPNSVLEVIQTFEEASDVKLNYELGPRRPGDVEQTYADVTKSVKLLGWKATRSLFESLRDAWNWQQKLSQ